MTKPLRPLRFAAVLTVCGGVSIGASGCQLDFNDPATRGLIMMIGMMFSPDPYPYSKVERKWVGGVEYIKRTKKDGTLEYTQVARGGDEQPMAAGKVPGIFPPAAPKTTTGSGGFVLSDVDKKKKGSGIYSTNDDVWMGGTSHGQQGTNHGQGGGGTQGGGKSSH